MEERIFVGGLSELVGVVSSTEDGLQRVQDEHGELGIAGNEEVTEGLDASLLNQEADLSICSTGDGISNSPARLTSDIEVTLLHESNQALDEVGIEDSLDLRLGSSGDVRESPASLLTDALVGAAHQASEG